MSSHKHHIQMQSPADRQFYGIAERRHAEGLRGMHAIQSAFGVRKTGYIKTD